LDHNLPSRAPFCNGPNAQFVTASSIYSSPPSPPRASRLPKADNDVCAPVVSEALLTSFQDQRKPAGNSVGRVEFGAILRSRPANLGVGSDRC
jgi:hypothetical protein